MNRDKLYRETLKLIKETNRRLERLERGIDLNKGKYNPKTKRFERPDSQVIINKAGKRVRVKTPKIVNYKTGSWASKKLLDRLDNYFKGGKIYISRDMTTPQLKLINKAITNFLKSKTSTISGILEVEAQTKQNIENIVSDVDMDSITSEDVNTLYDFFNDEDFQDVTQYIPPSDLYVLLMDSKSNGDSDTQFLRKIEMYIDKDSLYADSDMKEKLIRIYNKIK